MRRQYDAGYKANRSTVVCTSPFIPFVKARLRATITKVMIVNTGWTWSGSVAIITTCPINSLSIH